MDQRDDWPEEILEGDIEALAGPDSSPSERRSAERIARDSRNMNALLAAMGNRLSEGLPAAAEGPATPVRRLHSRRWRALVPLAAAAAVVTLFMVRGYEADDAQPAGPRATAVPSMVSEMDVEADRPFAVFPTNDPNMAVVWLLNLEESE